MRSLEQGQNKVGESIPESRNKHSCEEAKAVIFYLRDGLNLIDKDTNELVQLLGCLTFKSAFRRIFSENEENKKIISENISDQETCYQVLSLFIDLWKYARSFIFGVGEREIGAIKDFYLSEFDKLFDSSLKGEKTSAKFFDLTDLLMEVDGGEVVGQLVRQKLESSADFIEGILEDKEDNKSKIDGLYYPLFVFMMGAKFRSPKIDNWISRFFELSSRYDKKLLENFQKHIDNSENNEGVLWIKNFLKKLSFTDLEISDLLSCWQDDGLGENQSLHLIQIKKIEAVAPGSSTYLRRVFGIRCFGRYPEWQLLSQFEKRDSEPRNFGLFCVSVYAKKGEPPEKWAPADFLRRISDDLRRFDNDIFVIESTGLKDLLKKMIRLRSRTPGNAFSFLFIHAHGNTDLLFFSEMIGENGWVCSSDFENVSPRSIQKISSMILPSGQIILHSCFTGQQSGIAEKVSDKFKIPTLAPSTLVSCDIVDYRIKVGKEGGVIFENLVFYEPGSGHSEAIVRT